MRFIDEHRHDRIDGVEGWEFGVEPICKVLTEHGCKIAPSTYWAALNRPPCARAARDAELEHAGATIGAGKVIERPG